MAYISFIQKFISEYSYLTSDIRIYEPNTFIDVIIENNIQISLIEITPYVKKETIINNPNLLWDWYVSQSVSKEDIMTNTDLPWILKKRTSEFDSDFIQKHLDMDWNVDIRTEKCDWNFIREHLDIIHWNRGIVSKKINIQDILKDYKLLQEYFELDYTEQIRTYYMGVIEKINLIPDISENIIKYLI